jgi:hypothetical protein
MIVHTGSAKASMGSSLFKNSQCRLSGDWVKIDNQVNAALKQTT